MGVIDGWYIFILVIIVNFVTVIMPPVVFVVGFAYAVHVISDFERALAAGHEKIAAIKHSLGEVFVPFVKLEKHAANFLTNSAFDPESKIPEYKVCAVRIEKIDNTSSRKKRLITKESATA